jgi:hypothetical protein
MPQQTSIDNSARRTLAVHEPVRLDIAYHGARFIIIEFTLATAICLGLVTLEAVAYVTRGRAAANLVGGALFLSCGLNAVTFLALAVTIGRRERGSLRQDYPGGWIALYTVEAVVLLLAPLVFPLVALMQRTGSPAPAGAHVTGRRGA